jgi:outer membrane lipase/esterase
MGFLAFALELPASGAQAPFNRIVVFGTSLSDPGNYFALHNVNNTPPYTALVDPLTLFPDAAYAIGGHHLSNGATWIEQLALPLGLEGSVGAAFRSRGAASNYAVNGARAHNDGINLDLQEQVLQFTNDFAGVAPDGALYVMEMGSDDVFDALRHYLGGDVVGGKFILQQALTSIGGELGGLYQMGARRFFVWYVPDLGLTPAARRLDQALGTGTAIRGLARALAQGFNAQLALIVSNLQQLPGIDVKVFDAFKASDEIAGNPTEFGLSNVQDACIMPGVAPFQCQDAGHFLFWDGIHPTKAGHAITAQQAATVLGL